MPVPDALLVLLREGPKHGYQLRADVAARTASTWALNTGQIYTTLERLARDGLIEEVVDGNDGDERRRAYRLTADGRARAAAWLGQVDEDPASREEIVLRVMLVVGRDLAEAVKVIDEQRRGLLARLQAIRQAQRAAGDDLVVRLTADAAATRTEAELHWLDLCDERLAAANGST